MSGMKHQIITSASLQWWLQVIKPQPNDRNMSTQQCWAQNCARVWPPCCAVLQHDGCCWLKFEDGHIWANDTQHVATLHNWWPNAHNMLQSTTLRWHVALVWRGLIDNRWRQNVITYGELFPIRHICPYATTVKIGGNRQEEFRNEIIEKIPKIFWSIFHVF